MKWSKSDYESALRQTYDAGMKTEINDSNDSAFDLFCYQNYKILIDAIQLNDEDEHLLEKLQAATGYASRIPTFIDEVSWFVSACDRFFWSVGRKVDGIAICEMLIQALRTHNVQYTDSIEQLLSQCADAYGRMNQYEAQEAVLQYAIEVAGQTINEMNIGYLSLLEDLASCYGKLKKYELQEQTLDRVLRILATNDELFTYFGLAKLLGDLAETMVALNRKDEAETFLIDWMKQIDNDSLPLNAEHRAKLALEMANFYRLVNDETKQIFYFELHEQLEQKKMEDDIELSSNIVVKSLSMLRKSRQLVKEGLVQEGLDLARETEALILDNLGADSTTMVSAKIQVARFMMLNKEDAGSYINDLYEYVIENSETHCTQFAIVCKLYIDWNLITNDHDTAVTTALATLQTIINHDLYFYSNQDLREMVYMFLKHQRISDAVFLSFSSIEELIEKFGKNSRQVAEAYFLLSEVYDMNASDWRMAQFMWINGLRALKSVLGQDHPYVLEQQVQLQKWWVKEILGDR